MICFHINSLQFWQERVTCFWDKKGSLNRKVWTEVLKVRLEPGMSMVLFSRSVVSDSLQAQEEQHARPPCPSPSPRGCSNSCPLSRWCHPTISSSVDPLFLPPSIFPSIRVFSNESALRIRWPKYWSFSFNISPSNEYSGLISFRMDWLDLPATQGDSCSWFTLLYGKN